jgi:hypothetical protein
MADAESKEQNLLHRNAVAVQKDGSMTVPMPMIVEARQQRDSDIAECRTIYGEVQ